MAGVPRWSVCFVRRLKWLVVGRSRTWRCYEASRICSARWPPIPRRGGCWPALDDGSLAAVRAARAQAREVASVAREARDTGRAGLPGDVTSRELQAAAKLRTQRARLAAQPLPNAR